MKRHFLFFIFMVCTVAIYTSCDKTTDQSQSPENKDSSTASSQRAVEDITPSDSVLAEKYSRSCAICHTNPDAKAPLTYSDEWKTRIQEKGMDVLVDHAVNGFNAMPAMGQCLDCTKDEMKALILFMANQK